MTVNLCVLSVYFLVKMNVTVTNKHTENSKNNKTEASSNVKTLITYLFTNFN